MIGNLLARWSVHLFNSPSSCKLSNVELRHDIKAYEYRETCKSVKLMKCISDPAEVTHIIL